jgi:penicillin-binding protein 1C
LRWAAAALGAALTALLLWIYAVPFPQELLAPQPVTSTWVVDRDGRMLRELLNEQEGRGRWRPIREISPWMVQATLHSEDKRFYDHLGLDFLAMGRAAWDSASRGRVVSGASTLTQQTVKQVIPREGGRRSLRGKLYEMVWALRLERTLSKDEILEQYLNRAPYGNQIFGVEAASRFYLGKSAQELSLSEATWLVGLPRAPTLYNPHKRPKWALEIQLQVLDKMLERGAITQEQRDRAAAERPKLRPRGAAVLAPHFTEQALREARLPDGSLPDTVETTLWLPLQEKVEGIVAQQLDRLEDKHVTQAAVVVLDNKTGEVLAWVGSRDYFDAEHLGANDGAVALRQPGSALKPFVYGLYLERGGTPADLLHDLPTQFPTSQGVYIPQNYNRDFQGPVSLREALGNSLNVPAVEAASITGVEPLLSRLRELGFSTLTQSPEHYGLGLALGDGEVRLLDLANAYAALGRMGLWRPARFLRAQPEATARRVFSPEVSFQLLDVLTDDEARARSFGRHSALSLPYRVAVKTGTSTHYRDNWTLGTTPDYTVAVWVGNFDNSPMQNISGITGAGPILRQVFQALYPTAANQGDVPWFHPPKTLHQARVCALSGQPASHDCPTTRAEWLLDAQVGAAGGAGEAGHLGPGPDLCQFHKKIKLDARNGLLAGPGCDPASVKQRVFHVLPPRLHEWALKEGLALPPAQESPLCPGGLAQLSGGAEPEGLRILSPTPGEVLLLDPRAPADRQAITLRADARGLPPGERLTWFVDGAPLATVPAPFTTRWTPTLGAHTLALGRQRPERELRVQVHAP